MCGAGLPSGLTFCTQCGARLPSLAPPAPVVCRVCDAPMAPGLRFCTQCGAPAPDTESNSPTPGSGQSPPPTTSAAEPTSAHPDPTSRARSRAVWGISSLVGLLVIATGVGALLIGRSGNPSAQDPGTPPASPGSTPGGHGQDSPSQQTTTDESSAPVEPITYTCWNDREVERLRECPRPAGVAGLAWVFPSFHPSDCRNMKAYGPVVARVVFYECQGATPSGSPITFHYSIWRTSSAGFAHYDRGVGVHRTSGHSPGGKLVGYKWLSVTGSGEFKAAVMYARAPFTVSLYAPTLAARSEALDDVLQMRPPVNIRGVPSR